MEHLPSISLQYYTSLNSWWNFLLWKLMRVKRRHQKLFFATFFVAFVSFFPIAHFETM